MKTTFCSCVGHPAGYKAYSLLSPLQWIFTHSHAEHNSISRQKPCSVLCEAFFFLRGRFPSWTERNLTHSMVHQAVTVHKGSCIGFLPGTKQRLNKSPLKYLGHIIRETCNKCIAVATQGYSTSWGGRRRTPTRFCIFPQADRKPAMYSQH